MIAGRSRSPNRTGVALFDDYAVVDRHSQSFFIGSLSRMVHTGSRGRQEYKRPVAYDDPKRESMTCYTGRNNVFPYFENSTKTGSCLYPSRFRAAEIW